ncbi:Protein-tyrosine phosphatase, partial [Teladorsagia circumcincta]
SIDGADGTKSTIRQCHFKEKDWWKESELGFNYGLCESRPMCVEDEKVKCAQYWPTEAGRFTTYGKIFVNTKKVEVEDKFTIYTIELVPEGCSNSHVVKLIHMTNWPDRGVPASGRHVLRLLRKVVADKLDCGPIVMHCSAGVGRTGCIIMIDVILRKLFAGKPVDTVDIFKKLRDQRASSVPVDILYVFVFVSVIDYIRVSSSLVAETSSLIFQRYSVELPTSFRTFCQKF